MTLSSLAVLPEADRLFDRPVAYEMSQFAPVARVLADPTMLAVPASAPWKTVKDFVEDAKARPGRILTALPGPTARCILRWKCSRPARASNCCMFRFAARVRH
jgi:tripartite-type tricarboxylate transporter receptor subunit TctC